MLLGVNVDHIATIRQARKGIDPEPVMAATLAILGGADGITVHLREDRRHIQDRDLKMLKEFIPVELNLEMAATKEMVTLPLARHNTTAASAAPVLVVLMVTPTLTVRLSPNRWFFRALRAYCRVRQSDGKPC